MRRPRTSEVSTTPATAAGYHGAILLTRKVNVEGSAQAPDQRKKMLGTTQ